MKFDPTLNAQHLLDIAAALAPFEPEVTLVGTMFINGEGNDYDYVVYEPEDRPLLEIAGDLIVHGFECTPQESYTETQFFTMRKGPVNLMLTTDPLFNRGFIAAARVCRYVQTLAASEVSVLNRAKRIQIHRIIMNEEP